MTIYALSSGPGVSGIAVIRISGQETSKVIKLLTGKSVPIPRVATLRKINKINTSELIDEGIILWFPGPESYTGEDMAEIQVHGSKAVIDALQSSISNIENCRLAEPGEFTKLAFQNGKINLLKAESIADLISSETEIQRQQAIKIMNGKSADQFNFLREKLLKILSHVEAKIDFPDEDLPNDILKEIKKNSDEVLINISVSSTNSEDVISSAETIRNYIQEFNQTNENIKLEVLNDASITLTERTELLAKNIFQGMLLVLLFLSIFLNSRIILASLPCSR